MEMMGEIVKLLTILQERFYLKYYSEFEHG